MSDNTEIAVAAEEPGTAPLVTYILFLIGLLIGPATIVGLIMAYVARGDAPDWVKSHFRWLIRTFWIGFVAGLVGMITAFLMVGYLILIVTAVWYIVRVVRGFVTFQKKQAIADPARWGF